MAKSNNILTTGQIMDNLLKVIKHKSFRRGAFVLASGRTSDYLIDLKSTMLDPLGATLIADRVVTMLEQYPVAAIGGLAIGAVPIVAVTVARSYRSETPIRGFYVRKEAKDHGTEQLIDGLDVNGLTVMLVEDVTTTGGSLLKAALAVRNAGGIVSHAITVVDRLEGGAEQLAKHDITLLPILTRRDFD
jgi:orotate phosphoribosyltransferase